MKEKVKNFWKFVKENEELIFWMIIFSPVWIPIAIIIIIMAVIWIKLDPPKIAGKCSECKRVIYYGEEVFLSLLDSKESLKNFPEEVMYFRKRKKYYTIICGSCRDLYPQLKGPALNYSLAYKKADGVLEMPQKIILSRNKGVKKFILLKNSTA